VSIISLFIRMTWLTAAPRGEGGFFLGELISVRGIHKYFPGVHALDDVAFSVGAGEIHALVGENGAGKSTLVKILSGIHTPDSGEILFEGRRVDWKSPRDALKAGIAVIHQELSLAPHLSVAENIFLGREPRKGPFLDRAALRDKARGILARVHAAFDVDREVRTLIPGERQLVEIAKALSLNVKVLAMDEPTSSLSDRETENLFGLMGELRRQGVGMIYISHRLEEVFRIADTITVLRDGANAGGGPMGDFDQEGVVRLMVGRSVDTLFPRERPALGETVLEVEGLSCDGILKDISFKVRKGEILGFSGLVGSGRSDLARCLFGLEPYQKGTILIKGRPARVRRPSEALEEGLFLVPEDRKLQGLFLNRSVERNVTVLQLLRRLYGLFLVNGGLRRREALHLLKELNVRFADLDQEVQNLSGGNQQKTVIAKGLSVTPEILILDEPTRGIDVGAKAEIHHLMNRLTHEGMAVIMVSSELPEVLGMSDRVAVMREGRIAAFFEKEEATGEKIMLAAAGGVEVGAP